MLRQFSTGFLKHGKVDSLTHTSISNFHTSLPSLLFKLHEFPMKIRVFQYYVCVVLACLRNIATNCLRTMLSIFSPNLINQSSCRILTIHTKTWRILHDDWSIRLGENRPDRALKHLAAVLRNTAVLLKLEYSCYETLKEVSVLKS